MKMSCSFDSSFYLGEGDRDLRAPWQVHAVQALLQVSSSQDRLAAEPVFLPACHTHLLCFPFLLLELLRSVL